MSRALKQSVLISMTTEQMDYLGDFFEENQILEKKGVTFIQFVELWKKGQLEEVLN